MSRVIAVILSGTDNYGVWSATLGAMLELRERGHDVRAIAFQEGQAAEASRGYGFSTELLPGGPPPTIAPGLAKKLLSAMTLRRYSKRVAPVLRDVLRSMRADVTHVNWPNLVPITAAAAHPLGIPTLWHMPNVVSTSLPFGLNKRLWQRLCRSKRVVPMANSTYTASTLNGGGVRCDVIYVPISQERFDPDRVEGVTKAELGLDPGRPAAGVFGRLTHMKAQLSIVEGLASLGDDAEGLQLLLLGGPSSPADERYVEQIRETVTRLGLRVAMPGAVGDPERYYGCLDFTISAYTGVEAFGLSITESMLMRVPALVRAVGGPAETVVDGVTGWHVPEPSPESIASGIRRALADRNRWQDMGRAGRQRVLENYTMGPIIDRYERILERELGRS